MAEVTWSQPKFGKWPKSRRIPSSLFLLGLLTTGIDSGQWTITPACLYLQAIPRI